MKNDRTVWYRTCCTALAAVLLFFTSCAGGTAKPGETYVYPERVSAETSAGEETPEALITVFLCGAVKREGVYEVPAGSRLIDAVNAAGGFAEGAAERYENLARVLADGEKIVIPYLSDVTEDPYGDTKGAGSGLVNINTAGADELMTLPGIGAVRASAILDYRAENGAFASVEDLMKVSGIKQASFDRLKNYITVGP